MIVMKFGGTSLGNAERIKNAANIIKKNVKNKPVVVVSAVTKITDALIMLANECNGGNEKEVLDWIKKVHKKILLKLKIDASLLDAEFKELSDLTSAAKSSEVNAELLDKFQSFGERMSSKIVAAQLNKIGVKAQAFNSWELGFLTNSEFGNAEPLESSYKNIGKNIRKLDIIPVVTGFIGKTENGRITTIGRGGSDYTAAIVGASIDASEIQIWTDVNGIMSTDPRVVKRAKTIENVSFAEASELAYFGAKVLHPKTILPAMEKNIPVRVLNSFNPENKGTIITRNRQRNGTKVKSIACKKNICLVNVNSTRMLGAYGFLARIFSIFNEHKKSIDVISTSEVSVSMTVDSEEKMEVITDKLKEISSVEIAKKKAIICVVGEGIRNAVELPGRTFTALGNGKINIDMMSQGASKINITFVTDEKNADKAVKILHKEYFGE